MADDMFGDSSLFEEFEKEREPSGSFIIYENDRDGEQDNSKFIFQHSDSSSSDDSSDDENEQKLKVKEQSVASEVGTTNDQLNFNQSENVETKVNGDAESSSSESDEDVGMENTQPAVSKERVDKATTFKLTYERILDLLCHQQDKHF